MKLGGSVASREGAKTDQGKVQTCLFGRQTLLLRPSGCAGVSFGSRLGKNISADKPIKKFFDDLLRSEMFLANSKNLQRAACQNVPQRSTISQSLMRSEEHRLGQECVRTCRSRWEPVQ